MKRDLWIFLMLLGMTALLWATSAEHQLCDKALHERSFHQGRLTQALLAQDSLNISDISADYLGSHERVVRVCR